MDRRSFLRGGLSLIAAPAIVRVDSLMPVRSLLWADINELEPAILPSFDEIVTHTLRIYANELADNATRFNSIMTKLRQGA